MLTRFYLNDSLVFVLFENIFHKARLIPDYPKNIIKSVRVICRGK